MDLWSILQRARERWSEREAIVEGDTRLTYARLGARIDALAAGLRERGVRPQERVAILAPNGIPYLEAYFAAAGLGAVLVPLHRRLAPRELAAVLADCEPRWILADGAAAELLDEARAEGAGRSGTVWLDPPARGPGADELSYGELTAEGSEGFEPADVPEEALAQLYYTSGSTGRPKGVMLTHRNVATHAIAATSELDLAEDDVWGHVAPMFHLADAWATFALTWVGGRHAMAPRFDPSEVLALFVTEGVTITNLVPTMLKRLLATPPEASSGHALRLLLTGGAPIDLETVRAAVERFGCEYVQTYGMTETSPYLTLSRLRQHHYELPGEAQLRRRARTGRPFETVELQVVDETGRPVAWNDRDVGEIRARGETVSPGYWHRPQETAAAFRDGWLYTGDLARVDSEGYLQIVDRKKDVILSGGESVYSVEVEAVLYEHPRVLEAAVFGVPHEDWGEAVHAAVALSGPASEAELLEHCRARLARFKCPKAIAILPELPKTGSGKIHKAGLRGP